MSNSEALQCQQVFSELPDEWQTDLLPEIREKIAESNTKIVVLDDDPTGTQTVHDVTVLTGWSVDDLLQELADDAPCVFILTNTRSMVADDAEQINRQIARNLKIASEQTGRDFVIVSRGDSTLRGHMPLETDTLAAELEYDVDGILLVPAFMAGGRYTINSTHYVAEGGKLIPAAETPFAQDATFGYSQSNLCNWIAEKTNGQVQASDVHRITIDDIRRGGVNTVLSTLMTLQQSAYCAVDAVSERDLEVLVLAILQAETQGKRFLYRTAASFAAIRAGIGIKDVLSKAELKTIRKGAGLVVVGSYVPKSSSQLSHLLDSGIVNGVEIDVKALLLDDTRQAEMARVISTAQEYLSKHDDVVIYTSRELIIGDDANHSLMIGNQISHSLVTVTQALQSMARYIIAKGGITSSDLATKALQVKRARVIGQILVGIPVWQLGTESTEPDLTYIVFPGNVGQIDSLTQAVLKLKEYR